MILVIRKCSDCPLRRTEEKVTVCALAAPGNRPIPKDTEDRPRWCPLRNEQIIIREFK